MIAIVVFHALTVLLALGVASRLVPTQMVGDMLGYLHNTIGITTPSPRQVRLVALIWIGSVILIVDASLLLLVLIASLSNTR